jgi:uncharacterized protein (TIGR02444 family)
MSEAETRPPAQGSPFWRFSLAFYRQPGVAQACIALQETSGVDVNLLLFLLWHAAARRQLSASEVSAIEEKISVWREMTVIPLRSIRRALKSPPALVAPGAAGAFRTRVKAIELEAERLQQESMYELTCAAPPGQRTASSTDAARANVAAYESMLGAAFSKSALETLFIAFARLDKEE